MTHGQRWYLPLNPSPCEKCSLFMARGKGLRCLCGGLGANPSNMFNVFELLEFARILKFFATGVITDVASTCIRSLENEIFGDVRRYLSRVFLIQSSLQLIQESRENEKMRKYPLVMSKWLLKMAIYSGFSH